MNDLLSMAIDLLTTSTVEVFQKMMARDLKFGKPIEGDALRPKSNVVGTISFAGTQSGIVAFYSTIQAAQEIAAALLGMEPSEVNADDMPDAIGEVTNMIAGNFRTRLTDAGYPCAISIPTVIIGSDFYTKYQSDVRRTLCPFQMGDQEVFVELIIMKG
jgi:chemotaxis protein CheX